MLSPTDFVTLYPEFANSTTYPTATIQQWLTVAYAQLNGERWAAMLDLGAGLFTAHMVAVSAMNTAAAAKGAVPGQSSGPVASKSVGAVSVSYDTGAALMDKAGHWNLTNYGTRFLQLSRMVGSGPVAVL